MTEKKYALDLSNSEWISFFKEELKQPKFRADQVCQWIWSKKVTDVDEMTNLSLPLREELKEKIDFSLPQLVKEQRSKIDGTRKFLWKFRDGNTVETVLLCQGHRYTACISTQVGCPLQCTFCATGLSGYVRNLTAGEIAGQFIAMEQYIGRDLNNVVYMGMGEPFLNIDNVLKSVRLLNDEKMRNLGIRHITISTSGIIPGIRRLAESGLGVRLAISLHATNDALRSMLMPVNETFPVNDLRSELQNYQEKTGDRITIEYALFGGVNDTIEHARALVRFLKGIHVFINLIPFNAVDGRYNKPIIEDVLRFKTVLTTAGFEAEFRQEQGSDIDAACGQLRRKTETGEEEALEPKPYTVTNADMTHREKPHYDDDKSVVVKKSTSGGRKKDRPKTDRYRSGKIKEARPVYRGHESAKEDSSYNHDRPYRDGKKSNGFNRFNKEERGDKKFDRSKKSDRPYRDGKKSDGFNRFNKEERWDKKFDSSPKSDRSYRDGKKSDGFDRFKKDNRSYKGKKRSVKNKNFSEKRNNKNR